MELAPRGAWSFASRVRPSGPLQATCHLYRTSGHSSEPRRATRPSIELVSMIAASWWPFISPWCRRMTPLASTRWVTEPSSPTERNVSCTSTSRATHADQVLAHARSGGHLHAAASVEVALQARVSLVDRLCGATGFVAASTATSTATPTATLPIARRDPPCSMEETGPATDGSLHSSP